MGIKHRSRFPSLLIVITITLLLVLTSCKGNTTAPSQTLPSEQTSIVLDSANLTKDSSGMIFVPLYRDNVYLIDLNSDGVKEQISFEQSIDRKQYRSTYNLIINGDSRPLRDGENLIDDWHWSSSWVVLTDLDVDDGFFDIIHESTYATDFYFFDGQKIVNRDAIGNTLLSYQSTESFDANSKPTGLVDNRFDGHGGIVEHCSGIILSGWFYERLWTVAPNGLLEPIPQQGYYAMLSIDPKTSEQLNYVPVTLKMDLPLFANPLAAELSLVAKKGESAKLLLTDNRFWVQLETPSGDQGWFRIDSNWLNSVLVDYTAYPAEEVFSSVVFVPSPFNQGYRS